MKKTTDIKTRKTPAQTRSQETMNVILEAAIQVFEKEGYAGTTTNHIASRAGVSVGSVYQYFPNKESILYCLMEQHVSEISLEIESVVMRNLDQGKLGKNTVRKIIEVLVGVQRNRQAYHQIVLSEVPSAQRLLIELASQAEDSFVKLLKKILKATPACRKKNLEIAAITFVQTANWLTHRHTLFSTNNDDEDKAFIEQTVDLLSRYVLTE